MITAQNVIRLIDIFVKEYEAQRGYVRSWFPLTAYTNIKGFHDSVKAFLPDNPGSLIFELLSYAQWSELLGILYSANLELTDDNKASRRLFMDLVNALNLADPLNILIRHKTREVLLDTFGFLNFLNIYSAELLSELAVLAEEQIIKTNKALSALISYQGQVNPIHHASTNPWKFLPLTNHIIMTLAVQPRPVGFVDFIRFLHEQDALTDSHIDHFTQPETTHALDYLPILSANKLLTMPNLMRLAERPDLFAGSTKRESITQALRFARSGKQVAFDEFFPKPAEDAKELAQDAPSSPVTGPNHSEPASSSVSAIAAPLGALSLFHSAQNHQTSQGDPNTLKRTGSSSSSADSHDERLPFDLDDGTLRHSS